MIVEKNTKKIAKNKKPSKDSVYTSAIGRRKTAIARVRLYKSMPDHLPGNIHNIKPKAGEMIINGLESGKYFPTADLRKIILSAFIQEKASGEYFISVKVSGGGIHAQAEALRHGLSRALVKENEENRKSLKKLGFLSRDSRMKERRKFGLKKARKAPQWSKR